MHTIEEVWEHDGNTCVVIVTDMGHRCGYVGIDKSHPLYGVGYGQHAECLVEILEAVKKGPVGKRGIIPIVCNDGTKACPDLVFNVHGGITYSGDGDGKYPIELAEFEEKKWWFGYDCAHCDDRPDPALIKDKVWAACQARLDQCFEDAVAGKMLGSYRQIRTLDYCIGECESLSKQLNYVKSHSIRRIGE